MKKTTIPNAEQRRAFVKAITTAVRISREGGAENIELPDPVTGKIETFRLDREAAGDLLGVYLDLLFTQMLKDSDNGSPLAPTEREALAQWLSASNPPKNS